jgi:hypothetical protein
MPESGWARCSERPREFGLTDEEVWAAVLEVVDATPPGRPAGESIEAVAEAFAKRIEEKRKGE